MRTSRDCSPELFLQGEEGEEGRTGPSQTRIEVTLSGSLIPWFAADVGQVPDLPRVDIYPRPVVA